MTGVYTIPFDRAFLDDLAQGLLLQVAGDVTKLADYRILLPTNRSCKALRTAFLQANDGRPIILPTIQAISDIDEDALLLTGHLGGFLTGPMALSLPPAVPLLKRQLILTQLVLEFSMDGMTRYTPEQAARLAGELAHLLDQVQTEGIDLGALENLVGAGEQFSIHWQQVVNFLDILRTNWPKILEEDGSLDPADRRNRLLDWQSQFWQTSPPDHPVIAAGVTGSIPAVARLLKTIAALPAGMVVLPGLDQNLDHASWEAVGKDETHPQYSFFHLLESMAVARANVTEWPNSVTSMGESTNQRARLLSEVMRPAETSDQWSNLTPMPAEAISGLKMYEFRDSAAEARAIALMMRQVLETPGKTAALVTPDRGLARRVAGELRRWQVEVDDSAGIPLHLSPIGGYMRLLVETGAMQFSPVSLLALCKHPFASAGFEPTKFRAAIGILDQKVLRGPKPAAGLAGLKAHYEKMRQNTPNSHSQIPSIEDFLTKILAIFSDWENLLNTQKAHIATMVDAHITLAESLASTDAIDGATRLWQREDGEAMMQFLSELLASAPLMSPIAPRDYPAFFEAMMQGHLVRRVQGLHPRLFIYGPLEARLQRKDLMIIGGMNEKIWPPEAPVDPWMSRQMRRQIGLPMPEQRIGLAAHDFCQIFGAPQVVMCRADKVDGQPQVPSRWWMRLDVYLQMTGLADKMAQQSTDHYMHWQKQISQADRPRRLDPPAPCPPIKYRPKTLSVTRIEMLIKDPYSIYASKILNLKKLPDLEMAPGVIEKGIYVHAALEKFCQNYPNTISQDAYKELLQIGRQVFGDDLNDPIVKTFWWPRFERIAEWFIETERHRRSEIATIITECQGKFVIDLSDGQAPERLFCLTAKADRIDIYKDGAAVIIDYKTGTLPAIARVENGQAPQLPLEALILQAGGFDGLSKTDIKALHYWRVTGGAPAGEIISVPKKKSLGEVSEETHNGLLALLRYFADQTTPYLAHPRPEIDMPYNDYDTLSRYHEWRTHLVLEKSPPKETPT